MIQRPAKVTEFLSHMFPTEKDRLLFEITYCDYDLYNEKAWRKVRIELEMPTNAYIIKYRTLCGKRLINDANTALEIHKLFEHSKKTIMVDLTNTTKTQSKQLEYVNKLYGSMFKPSNNQTTATINDNHYIFIVRKSLCKNNALFNCYSLKDYNDDNYVFTQEDTDSYLSYIRSLCSYCSKILPETNASKTSLDMIYDELFGDQKD